MEKTMAMVSKTMKVQIEKICHVTGRGQIVVCRFPDEMFHCNDEGSYVFNMHVGDKVKAVNDLFEIRRIEQFLKMVGLIFDHEIAEDAEYIEIE